MSNPHLEANYFFAQQIMVDRLQETLPELPVRGIDSLATATDNDVRDAVVYVLFEGERFTDDAGNGLRNAVRQRFSAMLGVEHKRQNDDAGRNGEAGPLLSKIHKALAGFTHDSLMTRPFKRTNGRSPIYTPGSAIYPLSFEILINL
jgi:hypothetical protein